MAITQQKDDNVRTPRFGGDSAHGRRESVAATLRRARERHGQDVRSIAQVLRIRQPYLEALEAGQYDRLPGIAYAIGFLRSYANFLGLNPADLIDRFKEEAQGAERHTELVFPEPVTEARIPGGAVILISVVLLGVAYGGWFYLSNQGRTVADLIPALPEQLQTLLDSETTAPAAEDTAAEAAPVATPPAAAPAPAPPAATQAVSAEPAPPPAPPAEAAPPPPAPLAEAAPPPPARPLPAPQAAARPMPSAEPEPAPVARAEPEPAPVARAEPVESAQIAELPPFGDSANATDALPVSTSELPPELPPESPPGSPLAAAPAPAPERQLTLMDREQPADSAASAQVVERTVVIPAPPAAPAPPPSFAAPGERQPQTFGESNEEARIVLRAVQDTWVQVRDSHDALLLTRVLRAGDVYQVPNQQGLTLLTGNAGGIEIEVDGVKMPPLGPIGAVRRQIALDPAVLTTGATRQ